jgi:predicted acylesterase/phospholipase RssA
MDILGVFEGGGARGFAHIGALRATEQRGLRFKAVAGTSIGAIIASLVAAGYSSDELFTADDEGEIGILSGDLEALLLDTKEYRRVNTLRARLKSAGPGRLRKWILSGFHRTWWTAICLANLSFLAYCLHFRLLWGLWRTSGAVGTDLLREWLNDQLARKLNLPNGRRVTFQDLPIPLRVVATNLSTCDVEVFGAGFTPDLEVALAVTASAAFPFFFRPVRIGSQIFVDGGLVSNAPAWVLDDIRAESGTTLHTFNFKLLEPVDDVPSVSWPLSAQAKLLDFIRRLIPSSLNSRFALEARKIDDFHLIKLHSSVRTLDFDRIRDCRNELVEHGMKGVGEYYRTNIGPRQPKEMENALRRYMDLIRELLFVEGPLRSQLIQATGANTARCVYSAGYEGDADGGQGFLVSDFSPAKVLEIREPILMRCEELDVAARTSRLQRIIHAIRPPDVKFVYSIPIFADAGQWQKDVPAERESPFAAFVLQFNDLDDHLLLDPKTEDNLTAIAQAIGTFWTNHPANDPLAEENSMVPSSDWQELPAKAFYISRRKVRSPLDEESLARLEAVNRTTG